MDAYRKLMDRADTWYRSVQSAHSAKVPCRIGCRDCCLGLFEISLADSDMLREGLAKLSEVERLEIRNRAGSILNQLRRTYPDLGESLRGLSEEEIDEILAIPGDVECPALGPGGECRLYDHRPLVCRLAGVPVVDLRGQAVQPEGCVHCTLTPGETPPIDHTSLRAQEMLILRERYGKRADETLTIPQGLA